MQHDGSGPEQVPVWGEPGSAGWVWVSGPQHQTPGTCDFLALHHPQQLPTPLPHTIACPSSRGADRHRPNCRSRRSASAGRQDARAGGAEGGPMAIDPPYVELARSTSPRVGESARLSQARISKAAGARAVRREGFVIPRSPFSRSDISTMSATGAASTGLAQLLPWARARRTRSCGLAQGA